MVDGKEHRQVILRAFEGAHDKEKRIETPFTLRAAKNWTSPIGADSMKEFRVLREYLRNAVDKDPLGTKITTVDALEWAPAGVGTQETYVYLTLTKEIKEMLKRAHRYFKYLAGPKAVFSLPGTASAFPKSEDGVTRVFSLGTMAYCSKSKKSLYDYSVLKKRTDDNRPLVTEERTFVDFGKVLVEIGKLLSNLKDVDRIVEIASAIANGDATLEAEAINNTASGIPVPAAAEWLAAWKRMHGDDAVLASEEVYIDEFVRHTFGRRTVSVGNHFLRRFFVMCGVPEARKLVPQFTQGMTYRLVEPKGALLTRFVRGLEAVLAEYPEARGWNFRLFAPLTEEMTKTWGFCVWKRDDPASVPEVFILENCVGSLDTLIEVLVHEIRHGRTREDDHGRAFVIVADKDIRNLIMRAQGIAHEPELKAEDVKLPSVIVTDQK
ncbi:MAG TPA: hypothetical protein VL283_05540, partial [Candidatus Baltobacteraceae bacterium]|nr:hypothetical protein [Candidatus Baltobacteraceae bacterium]